MPFFKEGAVVHRGTPDPASRVGRLFPQPTVRMADGRTALLDDVIGPRFALLTWSARADAWIGDEARDVLRRLGAVSVVVRPDCQALHREPPVDGVVVADAEGTCKRWFDDAVGSVVLLRPDRVVAAACQPWELDDTVAQLAERLALVAEVPA